MTDHFYVDQAEFRRRAREFEALSAQLSAAESLLADGLQREGSCWGDDEPGSSFVGGYSPKASTVFANSTTHAKHLQDLNDFLAKAADGFHGVEERNTSSFRPGN
ncbi:hypothetical protein [Gordonia sputi]|uniref:hypothetical protein n=1 Tax=Gordonia sputi TaxID=36823 RepID=UPI0020437C09|nr:hypothetical protein [Gordonia sputi]MCM3898039.1 hypothetical protein [Gordonia sputi]